eukprot:scaffold56374_cov66-Phaeocystis_antarctica.AAC.2
MGWHVAGPGDHIGSTGRAGGRLGLCPVHHAPSTSVRSPQCRTRTSQHAALRKNFAQYRTVATHPDPHRHT